MDSTTIANGLTVGRRVRYFAGYGSIDGIGAIVAISDKHVDAILEDGRHIRGFSKTSLDRPGIGIKLTDGVMSAEQVEALRANSAKVQSDNAIAKAKADDNFRRSEAARVIKDAPHFYWNGIKDTKGGRLQPAFYSDMGPTGGVSGRYPAHTITIHAKRYNHFSDLVASCFTVQNDSDTQTDYFEQDRIRVIPEHPLYPKVKAALDAQDAHNAKRFAKRNGGAL